MLPLEVMKLAKTEWSTQNNLQTKKEGICTIMSGLSKAPGARSPLLIPSPADKQVCRRA